MMPELKRGSPSPSFEYSPADGWASHPEFRESLRLLVEDERYSLTDVGMMFGVSRERVRQWCIRYDIAYEKGTGQSLRGMFSYRQWDDVRNRFVPVRRSTVIPRAVNWRVSEARAREVARERWRLEVRAHIIAAAQALYARVGRPVSHGEIWREASGCALKANAAGPYLLCALGFTTQQSALARELLAAHDVPTIGRGRPAHVLQNLSATH